MEKITFDFSDLENVIDELFGNYSKKDEKCNCKCQEHSEKKCDGNCKCHEKSTTRDLADRYVKEMNLESGIFSDLFDDTTIELMIENYKDFGD